MRFASYVFDRHKAQLAKLSDTAQLEAYFKTLGLDRMFLDYAARVDGIKPAKGEWELSKEYMMPQINALVGRYSRLDQEAFYRFYLPVDETIKAAMNAQ